MWPSWSTKRMETSLSRAADTIYSSLANRRREPMNGGNWQQHGSAVSGSLCERCLHMSLLLRGDDSDAAANCSPPVMSCVGGVSEPYREM